MSASVIRDALAVIHTLDIHLAAAIGTVEQASQRSGLAPAVRVTLDIGTDALYVVKGLLVDDGFMGILKNRPFTFIDIVTFLVLEMLLRFEIDGMT